MKIGLQHLPPAALKTNIARTTASVETTDPAAIRRTPAEPNARGSVARLFVLAGPNRYRRGFFAVRVDACDLGARYGDLCVALSSDQVVSLGVAPSPPFPASRGGRMRL